MHLLSRLFSMSLVVVLSQACSGGSQKQACTTLGCGPIATIDTDCPLTFEQLQKAKITVCRNDTCVQGGFSDLNAPPTADTGVGVFVPVDVDAATSAGIQVLVLASTQAVLSLEISWPSYLGDPKDGDMYSVMLQDEMAQTLLSVQETVAQYTLAYPNGQECGPECHQVSIDKRT